MGSGFKPRNTPRARKLRREATPAEIGLWAYLRNRQLLGLKFSRQMPVTQAIYVDLLCRELKLVIELDGFSHDVDPGKDVHRDAQLQALGYHVLHISNDDALSNTEGALRLIEETARKIAHPQPLPQAGGESKSFRPDIGERTEMPRKKAACTDRPDSPPARGRG